MYRYNSSLKLHISFTDVKYYGSILDTDIITHNQNDIAVIDELKSVCNLDDSSPILHFPAISKEPEDEYDGLPIFSNAFPWLFPGGIGDINCNKKKEFGYVQRWASTMVHYFDGRFLKDGTWCFYALNYLQRHQNNLSGGFFVREFIKKNKPSDIDELKKQIQSGDHSFIDKLIYFSSKIRGSDSYWRLKKSQLYTWVYWHIEQGHGPPTLFITLSCAEYYWPDVKRLLEERIHMTENTQQAQPSTLKSKTDIMKAVNQYSIVVQEYFTSRVKDWMETFAKEVLKVTHYFVRFEFAKGRGEIHAHILAIADNMNVFVDAYKAENEMKRTEILSEYATRTLGLTSELPAAEELSNMTHRSNENDQCPVLERHDINAASIRLSSVRDYKRDIINLCNSCQMHKCGQYCMRFNSKSKNNKLRYCRAGCGYEQTEGKCDTEGFPVRKDDIIKRDDKGTKRLLLKRNNNRMIQTSLTTLQSWRSNCDIQLILYDSDPKNPDLHELAKVTDYVVSYACKGNCTHEAEKQAMLDIILR